MTDANDVPICTCFDDWHANNAGNHALTCPVIAAFATLTRERDEARKDAERLADVSRAALDAPIDLGELAGHSEGDAFRDGYELARNRIDAARTAALSEATP